MLLACVTLLSGVVLLTVVVLKEYTISCGFKQRCISYSVDWCSCVVGSQSGADSNILMLRSVTSCCGVDIRCIVHWICCVAVTGSCGVDL